jgi:hypothetical protein
MRHDDGNPTSVDLGLPLFAAWLVPRACQVGACDHDLDLRLGDTPFTQTIPRVRDVPDHDLLRRAGQPLDEQPKGRPSLVTVPLDHELIRAIRREHEVLEVQYEG